MAHFPRCDLPKFGTILVKFPKNLRSMIFLRPFPIRRILHNRVPKSAKLDKVITKFLLKGLKSAKYGQEYRDFWALRVKYSKVYRSG